MRVWVAEAMAEFPCMVTLTSSFSKLININCFNEAMNPINSSAV
uniref:Uncharacterized protein n=1 Tax=Amphimedon queenslandica TaxID=400682 RepID=A0A1X7UFX4_AMPQE